MIVIGLQLYTGIQEKNGKTRRRSFVAGIEHALLFQWQEVCNNVLSLQGGYLFGQLCKYCDGNFTS